MSRTVSDSGTDTSNPTSYDSGYSAYSVSGLNNALTNSSSTTYATINLTRGSSAETIIFYNFTLDGIPDGATINSVTCTAKCYISSTSSRYISTRQIQLYSGTTAKGSAYTVRNSTSEFTISAGTWTAQELTNAKIRLYARRNTSNTNTNYYFRFYGATLTVNYTYNYVVYEITATSNVPTIRITPASGEQQEGGNYRLMISGDITGAVVTDNNVDVTSSLTASGSDYIYEITNINADHTVVVAPASTGDKIFLKVNGVWAEADNLYVKSSGSWVNLRSVFKKENGSWVEKDKSAVFDENAILIKE